MCSHFYRGPHGGSARARGVGRLTRGVASVVLVLQDFHGEELSGVRPSVGK